LVADDVSRHDFGVLAFIWPGLTLLTLVFLYAVYAVIDGALASWGAIAGVHEGTTMALARADARREAVVGEANSIGTTALRARLLSQVTPEARRVLREGSPFTSPARSSAS
jgi:hypothetical protein